MSDIKQLDDLKNFAKYKTDLAKSVARVGKIPAPVLYVRKFQFNEKAAPLTLVGPVDSKLKAALVSAKTPMKLGKCVRRDDGKIVVDTLNAIEVHAAFVAGAVKDEIDTNGDFSKSGYAQVQSTLAKHLDDTGRSTADEKKREQAAGKILGDMEKSTNERNKSIDPSKPESHHVSAHGPGTDQVTRLVSGRRADEVTDKDKKGPQAELKGNLHGLPDQKVPQYDKTGQNPSNRSGAFSSNVAMLHAIEEAYAQAHQLDSYLDALMKAAFKANNEINVMNKPAVRESLQKLQNARKAAQLAATKLKTPGLGSDQVESLNKQVATLKKTADGLVVEFKQVFESHGGDTTFRLDEKNVGNSRLVRNVDPGTGKGFLPEGLGVGLEVTGDKQKKGDTIATDSKNAQQVMQERFQNIRTVGDQKTARVVMDPTFVKGKDGKLSRAGWDVQTAFPQEGPGQESFNDPKAVEDFVETNKAIKTKEVELDKVKKELIPLYVTLQNAEKAVTKVDDSIKVKTNLLPGLQDAHDKDPQDVGKKKKLDGMKQVIESEKLKRPSLVKAATEAKKAWEEKDAKRTELETAIQKLKESVEGKDD